MSHISSQIKTKMTYRGFSMEDILLLSEKNGQGEVMSKTGAKWVCAAKEWIDNYHGSIKSKEEFPWYLFDKFYESYST
jgi:hypothetical protein